MDAVILMAKAPIAGEVKTRLSPPLSPERAARIYEGMLLDSAAAIREVSGIARYLFHFPPGDPGFFRSAPFQGFRLHPQRGAELGERMIRAFETVFAAGAEIALVAGADCPALSPRRIRDALRELRSGADAVFGPTADGGFHLAGFRSTPAALFGEGIAWGTGSVLASVTLRCRDRGIPFSLLPAGRDIDTPDDLAWLEGRFVAGAARGFPETRRRISEPASGPGVPDQGRRSAGWAGRTSGR